MRLIDADALLKTHCNECTLYPNDCLGDDCDNGAVIHIKEAPTIEAVPVIRCKDCRHYDKSEDTPYCLRAMWWQDEGDDWFCAGAERKEHD